MNKKERRAVIMTASIGLMIMLLFIAMVLSLEITVITRIFIAFGGTVVIAIIIFITYFNLIKK